MADTLLDVDPDVEATTTITDLLEIDYDVARSEYVKELMEYRLRPRTYQATLVKVQWRREFINGELQTGRGTDDHGWHLWIKVYGRQILKGGSLSTKLSDLYWLQWGEQQPQWLKDLIADSVMRRRQTFGEDSGAPPIPG